MSSMQIDNPERGFSYKLDGPLDLRMNPRQGVSAAQRLRELDKTEFAGMLIENARSALRTGDCAFCLSQGTENRDDNWICGGRLKKPCRRGSAEDLRKARAERTFQALRIDVNREKCEVLYELLEKLPEAMLPGGRIAIFDIFIPERIAW